MEHRYIFGGSGGQGILLMGRLMGQALCRTDLEVLVYSTYGGEIRGGAADVFLTASEETVGSPSPAEADVLAALSFYGLARYQHRVAPGGMVLVNAPQVPPPDREDPNGLTGAGSRSRVPGTPSPSPWPHR